MVLLFGHHPPCPGETCASFASRFTVPGLARPRGSLLNPPKSSHSSQVLSRQQSSLISPVAATTYGSPRKYCKQKTYTSGKSLGCNAYKKTRGVLVIMVNQVLRDKFTLLLPRTLCLCVFCRCCIFYSPYTLPSSVSRKSFCSSLLCEFCIPDDSTGRKLPGCVPTIPILEFGASQQENARPAPCLFFTDVFYLFPRSDGFGSATGGQRLPAQAWPTKTAAEGQLPGIAADRPFLSRYLFNTNHKTIGLNYLWLALFSVFSRPWRCRCLCASTWLGRECISRSSPASAARRDRFAGAPPRFHGSLMVFLVHTAAPQAGFGNYFLPPSKSARAKNGFPHAESYSALGHRRLASGPDDYFLDSVSPPAITLWIVSVAIFLCPRLFSTRSIFSVTTIRLARSGNDSPPVAANRLGLVHQRHPWHADFQHSCWQPASACLSDRLLRHTLFPLAEFHCQSTARRYSAQTPSPIVLAASLLVFFAQAEVYVANAFPCFGPHHAYWFSTFSRKPVLERKRLVVPALCGRSVSLGFCVLGTTHVFPSGMNPFSPLVFFTVGFFRSDRPPPSF